MSPDTSRPCSSLLPVVLVSCAIFSCHGTPEAKAPTADKQQIHELGGGDNEAAAAMPAAVPKQVSSSDSQYWLSRTFVRADGSAATNAIVVITDLRTAKEVAVTKTDSEGHLKIAVPVKRVALTATLASEVVFQSGVDVELDGPPIALSMQCAEFRGRVEIVDVGSDEIVLRLDRVSRDVGDYFGVVLQLDGRFQACVPPGYYSFILPKELYPRSSYPRIPRAGSLSFRAAKVTTVQEVPETMSGFVPDSLGSFVANLPDNVKVLGIGESNHGSREFSDERVRLAIELARKKDFRLVMIEAGYGEVIALDDYIGGGKVDVANAVAHLGYWPWDTKTFLEALEQLRIYNKSVSAARRIHIIGFDVQTTAGAVDYLSHNPGAGLSFDEIKRLAPLGKLDGKAWTELSFDDQWLIRSTLERVAGNHDRGGAFSSKNRAALAARSLLIRVEAFDAAPPAYSNARRDAGMARMVSEVLALQPGARASLWAHILHLSREYVIGCETQGHWLAAKFGNTYQVYALLAYAGSARAWDKEGKIGVVAHQLPPVPPDSMEAVLYRNRGDAAITYWRFSRATGDAARWMSGLHRLHYFGANYPGDDGLAELWDLKAFDGVVLFERVTPTIPTPTGERVATPGSR